MSQLGNFKAAPKFRLRLNVGGGFDIPTGTYLKGKNGEAVLNGGVPQVTGIGGRGNTYKSTLMMSWMLTIISRYMKSEGILLDTEETLDYARLVQLANILPVIGNGQLEDSERFILTSQDQMSGSKYFDVFRKVMDERAKTPKDFQGTTPFMDSKGASIKVFNPFVGGIDSFSGMNIEALEKLYNDNDIGESGLNVEAMKSAAAKSQMVIQLPGVLQKGGGFMFMSAHLGDEIKMDQYAPSTKKLAFLKGDQKFKRVPENWTFLTGICWVTTSAEVMKNQTTKAPEYPRNKDDDLKGDTDLQLVKLQCTRNKFGPTGLPHEVIISQRDGMLPGLSAFHYVKTRGRFGLGGTDKNYFCTLVPEVAMSRTTVRAKINDNPLVCRALQICQELLQMKELWHQLPIDAIPDPQALYDVLKGNYDWNLLLNTRSHWMFEEDVDKETLPFLSTWDLLRMYHSLNGTLDLLPGWDSYHPYWYPKSPKAA